MTTAAKITRRAVIVGAPAALAACGATINGRTSRAERIDKRVDAALEFMFAEIPGTRDLYDRAAGVLVMPLVTKAGLGLGGAYGEGALRINGATVAYYSTAQASYGFQIGAQQYAHALFFMTPEALADFRNSKGWALGADVGYVVQDASGRVGVETTNVLSPIVAVVFGQAGLMVGASIAGTKYTRIYP